MVHAKYPDGYVPIVADDDMLIARDFPHTITASGAYEWLMCGLGPLHKTNSAISCQIGLSMTPMTKM